MPHSTDPANRPWLGRDPGFLAARALLERGAPTDLPLLLLGESGTGKELAARHAHQASRRAGGPFVAVHCGGLPDALIESELFGHARGAFTGAVGARPGLVEAAAGGTLFLDEIGDASPLMQTKLLRLLADGTFRRLGETATRRADVRVVAATHRDLESDVASGRFRADLWYRLAAVEVRLPPLRARPQDVLPLASAFLARRAPGAAFDAAAREALAAYRWPGNVRELEWAVAHAALFAESSGRVGAAALPARVRDARRDARGAPMDGGARRGPAAEAAAAEERRITQALLATGGRRGAAAKLLGVSRQGLWKKLRRLERREEDAWVRRS
jgi:two-component system NtrC family response regulator